MMMPRDGNWLADRAVAPPSMDLSTYPTTDLQQAGFFIVFFFPALALFFVGLRLYSRLSAKAFGWDDGFIIAAMVISVAEAGCTYVMMKINYIGVHVSQIPAPPIDQRLGMKWAYIVITLYYPQLGLVKSSVLLFLLRLGGHNVGIRRSIHILNIFNLTLTIGIVMANILTCVPVAKYWNRELEGHCNNEALQYVIVACITILTDILVLVIPVKIVMGLQMTRKLKIGLMFVLCLGLVVTVVGILRLAWLVEYNYGVLFTKPDFSYDIRFVYSTVECNLTIICASIPALSALIKAWFPSFFSKLRRKSRRRRSHHCTSSLPLGVMNGSSMALKDISSGRSNFHLHSINNSEEEIVSSNNIRKTTRIDVTFDDRPPTRSRDLVRWVSKFRYNESMRTLSDPSQGAPV